MTQYKSEETKNIDESSSFDEVLHAIKVLRTEIGNVIKIFQQLILKNRKELKDVLLY